MSKLNEYLLKICFSLPEKLVIDYVARELEHRKKSYTLYNGNLLSLTDSKKPIFSCHLDIIGNDFTGQLSIKNGKLKRKNALGQSKILGADDRAGLYCILNNLNYIDNFILTTGEETGLTGSRDIIKEFGELLSEFPCCIVLDRRGNSDIIGTNNYYCKDDLLDAIKKVLPSYSNSLGSVSDADNFSSFLPCVNLSVGYYNAHTTNEYLNLKELLFIDSKIKELNTITGEFALPDNFSYDDYLPQWYNDDDVYKKDTCDCCHMIDNTVTIGNITLCEYCIEEFANKFYS
jgi:hypothetical protein